MPKGDSRQQAEERDVVERFLRVAGIHVQPNDIKSLNPPHPDVLCSLSDGRRIAYELTETVDPNSVRNLDFSVSVKVEMRTYFENMSPSDQKRVEDTFGNADLYFTFDNGIGKAGFRRLLPSLFQLLRESSSDTEGEIAQELLPDGVRQIRIIRDEFVGPMFNASGLGLYVSDKTIERISDKFSKHYKCDCPIELLVHSKTQRLSPDILWLDDVRELVSRDLANSPFDRIWIFDYNDPSIRYVYPES